LERRREREPGRRGSLRRRSGRRDAGREGRRKREGTRENLNVRDRRGPKPPSAPGVGAQRREEYRRRGEEVGELVSRRSSRSDHDGAVLPSNAAGELASQAGAFSFRQHFRRAHFESGEKAKRETVSPAWFGWKKP